MENIDKKKLANEKRLKAIKEWQKKRTQVPQKISVHMPDVSISIPEAQKKVIYNNSENLSKSEKNKLKLFDSDEEEDFSNCFKIRPQFEGINGQRMLELNSELSERFKLDERFQEKEVEIGGEEDQEKDKNIRILESILGHEVSKKHPIDVNARKKRELKRFDPEDENAKNFIKAGDTVQKKRRKKEQKNEELPSNVEIPYSSERYIEVAPDLKNIISSASPFSFSEKFNTNDEIENSTWNDHHDIGSKYTNSLSEKELLHSATDELKLKKEAVNFSSNIQRIDDCHTSFQDHFFISSTDDRLKEGIKFFMRPKPLDEIREEWLMKREEVLEIFKRRKKSAQRRSVQRPKKQNQKKSFLFKK